MKEELEKIEILMHMNKEFSLLQLKRLMLMGQELKLLQEKQVKTGK